MDSTNIDQLTQHHMQNRQDGDFHKLNCDLNLPKMSNVLTAEFHIVNTIQYFLTMQNNIQSTSFNTSEKQNKNPISKF